MRNLIPFNESTIDFHDLVVARKRNHRDDVTYKDRLRELRSSISQKFNDFDLAFDESDFTAITAYGYEGNNKTDLLKLYSYRSKLLQELKVRLTTQENNRVLNTCQYCTLNEVNSFDHYLPKDEFAELVVNPKNLIPSCSNCNGRKGIDWVNGGERLFINLYVDSLPECQYLFVEVQEIEGVLQPRFFLENRNGVQASLFNLLVSHYEKLDLCNRFTENSNNVVTELQNLIQVQRLHLSRNEIVEIVTLKAIKDKAAFGQNYWKPILEITLVESHIFMDGLFH